MPCRLLPSRSSTAPAAVFLLVGEDRHGSPPAFASPRVDVSNLRCEQGNRPVIHRAGAAADHGQSQRLAQGGWPPVLLQQVAKRFIRTAWGSLSLTVRSRACKTEAPKLSAVTSERAPH